MFSMIRSRTGVMAAAVIGGLVGSLLWAGGRSKLGVPSEFSTDVTFGSCDEKYVSSWFGKVSAGRDHLSLCFSDDGWRLRITARSRASAARDLSLLAKRFSSDARASSRRIAEDLVACDGDASKLELDLKDARSAIMKMEAAHSGLFAVDPESGENLRRLRHTAASREEARASAKLAASEEMLAALREDLGKHPETISVARPSQLSKDERKKFLAGRLDLAVKRRELRDLLVEATEFHPHAVALAGEIEADALRLAPLEAREHPKPDIRPNPERVRMSAEITRCRGAIATASADGAALREERTRLSKDLDALDRFGAEHAARRRELDGAETKAAEIATRRARLQSERTSASRAVLTGGTLEGPPPLFDVTSASGMVAGLAAGIAVAALGLIVMKLTDKGFSSPKQLRAMTGLPVLAALGEDELPEAADVEDPPGRAVPALLSAAAALVLGYALAHVAGGFAASSVGSDGSGPVVERPDVPVLEAPESAGVGIGGDAASSEPGTIAPTGGAATPEGGTPGTEAGPAEPKGGRR